MNLIDSLTQNQSWNRCRCNSKQIYFISFDRILKFTCWPGGVIHRLIYDYESFPHPVDDQKCACIVMQNHKKIDEKHIFHRIFYPNLTFFRSLWRSLRPSWCFLRVYYWLKYDYGSFSQSSRDAKNVRIGLKNKKKFCWKKIFHRNFWLKFDISHGVNMRKVHCLPTLSVKKFFETLIQKSASTVLLGLIWSTD